MTLYLKIHRVVPCSYARIYTRILYGQDTIIAGSSSTVLISFLCIKYFQTRYLTSIFYHRCALKLTSSGSSSDRARGVCFTAFSLQHAKTVTVLRKYSAVPELVRYMYSSENLRAFTGTVLAFVSGILNSKARTLRLRTF